MEEITGQIILNIRLKRELAADIDRMATLNDMHRYQLIEQLVKIGFKEVEEERAQLVQPE